MSIASKPKVIVAAIASRPYVKAAVACGFEVVAIDAFADADVRNLAETCYEIEFIHGQLNMKQLLQVMVGLDLDAFVGFCYGAGFEKEPAVLSEINTLLPVFGNLEQALDCCYVPADFFALCKRLQLPYPEVMFKPPPNSAGWLCKAIGTSGGSHIARLSEALATRTDAVYYQHFQAGKAVSCLFVASGNEVQVVGFNEQFISAANATPFRYGGAVSHVAMSDVAKANFEYYVHTLSKAIGLVGINSCDAICDGDDIYILEVNPRLSATMALYEDCQLFEKHMAAVAGQAIVLNPVGKESHAEQIIYAESTVVIKGDIIWPKWINDRPSYGSLIKEGMPVCTVVAEAETAEHAKRLVNERAATISREFLH